MPAIDNFANFSKGLTAPLTANIPVALSDTTDLATLPRAWIPSIDGTVVLDAGGSTALSVTVKAGLIYAIRANRFRSTGTTGGMAISAWE